MLPAPVRWDPAVYAAFGDHRSRPFVDLVARIGADAPRTVVDLGCGSGELTASLLGRWPTAQVTGIDTSAEMLARVPRRPGLRFVHGDIAAWRPDGPVDVVLSNAALQWVDGHPAVLRRAAAALSPGGWLAFQVPGNFAAASHRLLPEIAARWAPEVVLRRDPVLDPAGYAELLTADGLVVDAWETTYLHVLTGPDPVLEWTRGTALRPILAVLSGAARAGFLAEYAAALRAAYPAGPHGTTFPFRRIFVVARRPAQPSPEAP